MHTASDFALLTLSLLCDWWDGWGVAKAPPPSPPSLTLGPRLIDPLTPCPTVWLGRSLSEPTFRDVPIIDFRA